MRVLCGVPKDKCRGAVASARVFATQQITLGAGWTEEDIAQELKPWGDP